MGIQVYGEYCLITQNFIHDCNIFLSYPNWGPVGIMLATSNNEISYNHFRNYYSIGGSFGADGGADTKSSNILSNRVQFVIPILLPGQGFEKL